MKPTDYVSELQTLSSGSSHQVLNQLNILNYSHNVCSVYIYIYIYIYIYMCVCVYIYIYIYIYIYMCVCVCVYTYTYKYKYTGCHRRKGPNFWRVFLMLNYTDITQNTYIQS